MSIVVVWIPDEAGWRDRVLDDIATAAQRDGEPIAYAVCGDWRDGAARAVKLQTPGYHDAFRIAGGFVRGTITQD